jgi:hypothetical protein
MRRLLPLFLLCATPAYAAEKPLAQTVLFVAAQAALTMDALQTMSLKNTRHPGIQAWRYESGFARNFIGATPSDGAVLAYFGTIAAAQTALYLWGPQWLSNSVSGLTLVIEIPVVAGNFSAGVGFSF